MTDIRNVIIALDASMPFEWHQQVYIGTQRYARDVGNWRCVIDESPCDVLPKRRSKSLNFHGVIARADKHLADRARRLKLPLVNTWLNSPVVNEVPTVRSDHSAAGVLCAEHLLHRGFKRFGFLAGKRDRGNLDVHRAFVDRLFESDIGDCANMLYGDNEPTLPQWWSAKRQALYDFVDHLKPPVGIVAMEPLVARQIVHRCHQLGWVVPQDVAIICDQHTMPLSLEPPPSLSGLDNNQEGCGYEAARLLDRLMDGEPAPNSLILVPPKDIVQRDSTDYFAVEDELVAEALRYITTHITDQLSADIVAAAVYTSESTLRRKFKEHLSRSFATEVRRLRVSLAKRLLADSDQSIKQIAVAAGFADAKRMHEVFQRDVGQSPSGYRELLASR